MPGMLLTVIGQSSRATYSWPGEDPVSLSTTQFPLLATYAWPGEDPVSLSTTQFPVLRRSYISLLILYFGGRWPRLGFTA